MKKFPLATFAALIALSFSQWGCGTTGQSVVSPSFQARQPERIAILQVAGDIRGTAAKNQVEDIFAMELMKKGYGIVERSRVQRMLEEQGLQVSEVTAEAAAAKAGEVLNVAAVAMIDVNVEGEHLSMTGRLVDTETGEALWIGSGRGGSGRTLATVGGAAAGAAVGTQVGGGRGTTAAIIAGGILGGAAGDTLAPRTLQVVERAIQKMVEGLPSR